jgi:ribosomal protein S18 acetylase RimI-like enzyme
MTALTVERVTSVDVELAADLSRLLPQVSARAAPLTQDRVQLVLETPSTSLFVARDGSATVGMALLVVCTTLAGQFGHLEEVAVDESARSRHIGIGLIVEVLRLASDLRLDFIELTSRPSRVAANNLYRTLGFRMRETNVFRHDLAQLPESR